MHDSMEEFLAIERGSDKADSTLRKYEDGLGRYSDWLDDQDIHPTDITQRDFKRYIAYLREEHGLASNTVRSLWTGIAEYYRDLYQEGLIDDNPIETFNLSDYAPKTSRKEQETKQKRDWLDKEEVQQLVNNVPSPTVRNRLLVLFQYFTGLRRAEVVNVKLSDLDRENRQVQVRGKGSKTHTAFWQPKLDGLLLQWLDGGYRAASPYAEESDYLFLSEAGPSIKPQRLNKVVVQAAKNAGIQETLYTDAQGQEQHRVTSHILRHSYAMHWLQNGGSIEGLSKAMAHNSVETTEIYGEILDKRAREEYEEYGPGQDIEI